MSYVPPALRHKQEAASKGKEQDGTDAPLAPVPDGCPKYQLHSLKDIQKHFWSNWVPETLALTEGSDGGHVAAGNNSHNSEQHAQPNVGESSTDDSNELISNESPQVSLGPTHAAESNTNPDREQATSQQLAKHNAENIKVDSSESSQQLSEIHPKKRGSASDNTAMPTNTEAMDEGRRVHGNDSSTIESVHPHNTLNSTEESPETLQYVLLFRDANPRWPHDQIIYVKSALDLLPIVKQNDEAENNDPPQRDLAKRVMIFEQQNGHRTVSNAMFRFIGYFNLSKMEVLEPHTPELVRMQEQKWTRTDKYGRPRPINRNAEGWKKSLSQRWAVLKFEKDEEATKELQPPQIKTISNRRGTDNGSGQDRRGVNELLREMRLKDGS